MAPMPFWLKHPVMKNFVRHLSRSFQHPSIAADRSAHGGSSAQVEIRRSRDEQRAGGGASCTHHSAFRQDGDASPLGFFFGSHPNPPLKSVYAFSLCGPSA